MLNNVTLHMVVKAKTQLLNILSTCGFPSECLTLMRVENTGQDTNVDILTTLLVYGKQVFCICYQFIIYFSYLLQHYIRMY
jgi:hypothetical protein